MLKKKKMLWLSVIPAPLALIKLITLIFLNQKGLSRFAQYENNYLIEFQATINPDNSGGPLINGCGIIGILTSRSVIPEVVNIGFAISSISISKQLPALLAEKTTQMTAPDFNPVMPSYSDNPPYSYYEQYNITEETIEKAKKLKETINQLR